MLRLEFDENAAKKIPDVAKALELQADIAKLFRIRDFDDFADFVEEDLYATFAEDFAREYGFYDSGVYDRLYDTALKMLTDLNTEYRLDYEDYQGYLEECDDDEQILYYERRLISCLETSLEWGSYDLANAVIALRQSPIKRQDLSLVL